MNKQLEEIFVKKPIIRLNIDQKDIDLLQKVVDGKSDVIIWELKEYNCSIRLEALKGDE